MTTFNNQTLYVWVWLPDANSPIIAGKLEVNDQHHDFYYGQSYIHNKNAISLSPIELPLTPSTRFTSARHIHHVFRDALPEAWG